MSMCLYMYICDCLLSLLLNDQTTKSRHQPAVPGSRYSSSDKVAQVPFDGETVNFLPVKSHCVLVDSHFAKIMKSCEHV